MMTESAGQAQIELYGATWAARFGTLRKAYGLSQGALAAVVGLSAPMVSQLVSGQRVKISNPSVLARIVRLEEFLTEPGVSQGDRAAISRVLESLSSSTPVLRTTTVSTSANRETAVAWLRDNASAQDLEALAEVAHLRGARALALTLEDAAGADAHGAGSDGGGAGGGGADPEVGDAGSGGATGATIAASAGDRG